MKIIAEWDKRHMGLQSLIIPDWQKNEFPPKKKYNRSNPTECQLIFWYTVKWEMVNITKEGREQKWD